MSSKNEKDLKEINPKYIDGLTFHFVDDMMEVVEKALLTQKVAEPLKVA